MAPRRPALVRFGYRRAPAGVRLARRSERPRRPDAPVGLARTRIRRRPAKDRCRCRRQGARAGMKVALVNPAWTFDGSIYFGCRHPHLPLEYGSAKVLLEAAGHQVEIVDGHLFGLSNSDIAAEVRALQPDMTVVTTAPS